MVVSSVGVETTTGNWAKEIPLIKVSYLSKWEIILRSQIWMAWPSNLLQDPTTPVH